ncbi:MAG TPA: thioredoxin-like domain-containing protein [Blastocatellia bacterium]
MPQYEGKVNAPDFPAGLQWLNTDRPLSLHELRGKVVLLDFWTFCCINCMHIIPDLKRLEHKYSKELVVIGVHSAKFTSERDTDNIRQAVLRYGLEHPVVNDGQMQIWNEYAVKSWPTLMVIDPVGKVVGYMSGEGIYDPLDKLVGNIIKTFDAKNEIDRRPLQLKLERDKVPASILDFPGKVLADEASKQLFISDSNHNRIVIVGLDDSTVKQVIGGGDVGFSDGSFEQATFNHPQGMAFDGSKLYVADTENHAIRLVDFDKRTVTTIAGTGHQAEKSNVAGPGATTALNSPWDLLLKDKFLYIAMAGPHEIWRMDLNSGKIGPYAGTGREARIDGGLGEAAFAQPSGITTDGKRLYVADSECSSIRSVDLHSTGEVKTVVGGDLFEYGDVDAKGEKARLQHPLGVAYGDGALYVADTYNNKIKRISLKDDASKTFLGTGKAGYSDGDHPQFSEPGGLSIAGGKLYIADTNNHVIRVADLASGQVSTLEIKGLDKLAMRPRAGFTGESLQVPEQIVAPGQDTIEVTLNLPSGYKLNPAAPSALKLSSSAAQTVALADGAEQTLKGPKFPVSIPINVNEGTATLQADFTLYYCESEKESLCYFKEARLRIPVKVEKDATQKSLAAAYKLTMP